MNIEISNCEAFALWRWTQDTDETKAWEGPLAPVYFALKDWTRSGGGWGDECDCPNEETHKRRFGWPIIIDALPASSELELPREDSDLD